MTPTPEHLIDVVDTTTDRARRREAAKRLAVRSDDDPEGLADHAKGLVSALAVDDRDIRVDISCALYNVGLADPEAIVPHLSALVHYLDVERPCRTVRSNLARPIGEGVADSPWRVDRADAERLAGFVDDEGRHVRLSVARALEKLAVHCPVRALPAVEAVHDRIDDDHPAVRKRVLRTLAHLVRYDRASHDASSSPDGLALLVSATDLEVNPGQVLDALGSDEPSVRSAAATLAGAIGTAETTARLREHSRDEPEADVRVDVDHARREAAYPVERDDGGVPGDGRWDLHVGDWVSVAVSGRSDACDPVARTGGYRGRVTDTTPGGPREVVDGRPAGDLTVELSNPFEGYHLRLSTDEGRTGVVYTDRRQSDPLSLAFEGLSRRDPDVLALLYAVEGDRLRCSLDRGRYEGEVTTAAVAGGSYRVTASDDRGHAVTFEPCGQHPTTAMFDAGRCVPDVGVELISAGPGEPEA